MGNSVKFRQDKAEKIAELMERARQLDNEHQNQPTTTPVREALEADPGKVIADGPAHRSFIKVSEQFDKNMVHTAGLNPETFGKREDGSKVVVKSSGSELDSGQNHRENTQGVSLRSPIARGASKKDRQSSKTPMHVSQPIAYEKAVDDNEARMDELKDTPTTGAVAELDSSAEATTATAQVEQPAPAAQAATSTEVLEGQEEVAPQVDPELTSADFNYDEARSAFYAYAEGAVVESGEGKSVEDRERTHTMASSELYENVNEPTKTISVDELAEEDSE